MRSKKCIGFLILFALCVPSLLMSLDASALKHEYDALNILNQAIPTPQYDSSDDNYYIDWHNEASSFTVYGSGFRLRFDGNSWNDSLKDLRLRKDIRFLDSVYSDGSCHMSGSSRPLISSYNSGGDWYTRAGIDPNYPYINAGYQAVTTYMQPTQLPTGIYIPDYYEGNKMCWSRSGMSSIDRNSYDQTFNNTLSSYPSSSGFWDSTAIYNVSTVLNNDNVLPYNWYTEGLYYMDSHKQSDGIVYNKRFSFSTIFNQSIKSFSNLDLYLDNYNGYWYDDNNLYNGRSIDFHFLFNFDESVSLEQTFVNGGSLKLKAVAQTKHSDSDPNSGYPEFDCTSTIRVVGDNEDYYWDISCPVILQNDYIIFVPYLSIDGNGNKVFSTDGDWSFSSVYIVTDHDDTPSYHFNSSLSGNTNVWDAYWSDNDNQYSGTPDWLQSLINLFTFSFINPFAPIFQMFSDNNSCAQIPIIAGMLHSEETEVCPWFDSTTRNIVTPVLGLSAMMLVFGFAVRWLGSHSGNMFEDTGQHDFGTSSTLKSKYRRRK